MVRHIRDGRPWTDEYLDRRVRQALDVPGDTDPGSTRWFIGRDGDGAAVGLLTLTRHVADVEVGYWVDPGHWRRGHAGRLLARRWRSRPWCGPPSPSRAVIHPDNAASRAVRERDGFLADPADPAVLLCTGGADAVRPAPG